MIGLGENAVRLNPYTKDWERLFREEKSRLQIAVGLFVLDIQHVGSTSIPGMIAKPIIDIAIAVESFEEANVCIKPIESLGYQYRGENNIPRRHFFVKGNPRTYHIHINEIGSRDWNEQISFRDYLIHHQDIASGYAELKMELAQRYPTDRQAYSESKSPFIKHVVQLAGSEVY